MGLLRVMSLIWLGRSTLAPNSCARITQRVVRDRKPRSPEVGTARARSVGTMLTTLACRAGAEDTGAVSSVLHGHRGAGGGVARPAQRARGARAAA